MEFLKRYFNADAQDAGSEYGYESDEIKVSPFNFGLNAAAARLTKFEWIPNGGKEGVEQEAADVIFNINGTDKSYRMFPVTKVFGKDGNEITDTTTKEYAEAKKEAQMDFNARITHILHAFLDQDTVKASLSRPFKSFKEFIQFCSNLLPKNFAEIPLDIFVQYQWQPSEGKTRTYLEIPKKMKYGAWLKASSDFPGTWTEHRAENITESTRKALWYTNEKGEEHAFHKNGWFMLSPFANMQGVPSSDNSGTSEAASNMNAGTGATETTANTAITGNTPPASAW